MTMTGSHTAMPTPPNPSRWRRTTTIKAIAIMDGNASEVTSQEFTKSSGGGGGSGFNSGS